jgi:Zn-dependent M28 family amino/carboxypeptidase
MRKLENASLLLTLPLAVALIVLAGRVSADTSAPLMFAAGQVQPDLKQWQGDRALEDIKKLVSFGPRSLNVAGHQAAINFIQDELAKTSAVVQRQRWSQTDQGVLHTLTNIVARFAPDAPRRVIIGTHYDSIIRAYRDAKTPNAPMPGANNGASGVAILLETARALKASEARPSVGVDLIFFDGEEGPLSLGAGDPNWRPLGSPYFANRLTDFYPSRKPAAAVIFDMVCYRDLKLNPEPLSLQQAETQVKKYWDIGTRIGPTVFSRSFAEPIEDDHIPLGKLGIPAFLVIGWEYEPWFNTTNDTIDKCSTASLEVVGRTTFQYLYDFE